MFKPPEKELSLGEVISWTVKLYRSRFLLLYAPFLVASLIFAGMGAAMLAPLETYLTTRTASMVNVAYASSPTLDATTILLGAVFVIIYFLIEYFLYGFTIVTSADLIKGGRKEVTPLLIDAYRGYWRYIAATLLLFIGGAVAFIVPTIFLFFTGSAGMIIFTLLIIVFVIGTFYFIVRLCLYSQVMYLEDAGALKSLRRSYGLLRGRVLIAFILLFVIGIISGIITIVGSQIGALLSGYQVYLGAFVSDVFTALVAPFYVIALTVYYYSMKVRLEPPLPPQQTTTPQPPV